MSGVLAGGLIGDLSTELSRDLVLGLLGGLRGDLPHGLAPPLHLLEPWWRRPETWGPILGLLLFLLLAAAAWWLLRRALRNRPAPAAASPPPGRQPSTWVSQVHRIWSEHRDGGDLRRGLAELSRLLRDHFAPRVPAAARRPGLTAGEVARHVRGEAAHLLGLVSLHLFGRREPRRQDFDKICQLAVEVLERDTGAVVSPAGAGARSGRLPEVPEVEDDAGQGEKTR